MDRWDRWMWKKGKMYRKRRRKEGGHGGLNGGGGTVRTVEKETLSYKSLEAVPVGFM